MSPIRSLSDWSKCAPEVCRIDWVEQSIKSPIGSSVNTWSFGAVLRKTAVWCALGNTGIEMYRRRRLQATKNVKILETGGYGGCFHNGERVLYIIEEMHRNSLAAAEGDVRAHGLLREMSFEAESMLIEEPNVRPVDGALCRKFQNIIRRVMALIEIQGDLMQGNQGSVGVMPGPVQPLSIHRMSPPELPPAEDLSPGSDQNRFRVPSVSNDDGFSILSGPAFSQRAGSHSPALQAPSILPHDPRNEHASNGILTIPHVTFQNVNKESNYIDSASKYPEVTIRTASKWIAKKKRNLRSPLASTSPEFPELSKLSNVMGRDQVIVTKYSTPLSCLTFARVSYSTTHHQWQLAGSARMAS
jgi:hypothetical protein